MGNNMGSFKDGFKRARENAVDENGKRYTQRSFAKAFGTSRRNVINWENGVIPRKEALSELCDFFQCDPDYLFMRSEVKKHDVEFIMEYTGLSEKAVEKLVEFKENSNDSMINLLNKLLLSDNFENTLDYFEAYLEKAKECKTFEDKKNYNDHWRNISRDRDYLKYETSTNFNYTLDELGEADRETVEILREAYFSNPD